jgi:hypothetical protein
MRKLFTIGLFICFALTAQAQSPTKFNYQGIARIANGTPLASQPISMRISIMDTADNGPVVYSETHSATTNAYGLYNVTIGGGTVVSGDMGSVNWGSGNKYIKVEMDPTGGTTYADLGSSQLLSVPFALYATSGTPGPVGPAGPIGLTGPAGPIGATGNVGATGPAGPIGLTGLTGATGAIGPVGPSGATGPAGPMGLTGLTGATGAIGAIGPVGPAGATGPAGPIGLTGLTGAPGAMGPAGATGPAGPIGATGAVGAIGPIGLTGLTGPAGPTGAVGATGATGPAGPAGVGNINGTTNNIMKFTGATAGGNSQLTDDGTSVGVNVGALSSSIKLQVNSATGTNAFKTTLVTSPPTTVITPASIYGESTTAMGVLGVSNTQNGVYGLSASNFGGTVGVNSGAGYGIWGISTGTGAAGYFDGGTTGKGIIVLTGSSGIGTTTPTGRLSVIQPSTPVPAIDTFPAITGSSYATQGCLKGGVFGTYNGSNYGAGVQGVGYNGINNQDVNTNFTTGNQDLGVYGSANTAGVEGTSTNGIGVVGYNKAASFAATTGGGNSYGVYAYANTIGGAAAPTTRYGLYGYATGATTNYAGYFSGNVQITGSIAKASGTFKIDDPIDPANKYLYHSFVESPDMMNIYNGNIVTDANGYATVKMPAYFEALNEEFRYQLTVIGTFAQAIISEEISSNHFIIQTNQPNVKVSWQVTGIRHDKYADAHRIVAEVEKEPEFKGYYLHAKEWGQPESKSIDALTRPKQTSEMESNKTGNSTPAKPETPRKDAKSDIGGAQLKVVSK